MSDAKPWDLINGSKRSPEDIKNERLAICDTCEFFKHSTRQCRKCGCFMDLKSRLDKANCPMKKW
jgi:hypothetical protein